MVPYRSLQFDPAPRAGEPLVSRRVPDYFLVCFPLHSPPHAVKLVRLIDTFSNIVMLYNERLSDLRDGPSSAYLLLIFTLAFEETLKSRTVTDANSQSIILRGLPYKSVSSADGRVPRNA